MHFLFHKRVGRPPPFFFILLKFELSRFYYMSSSGSIEWAQYSQKIWFSKRECSKAILCAYNKKFSMFLIHILKFIKFINIDDITDKEHGSLSSILFWHITSLVDNYGTKFEKKFNRKGIRIQNITFLHIRSYPNIRTAQLDTHWPPCSSAATPALHIITISLRCQTSADARPNNKNCSKPSLWCGPAAIHSLPLVIYWKVIEIFTTLHSNPFSDNKQSITIAPIIALFYMLVIGWSLFFTGKFSTAKS